MKYRNFVGKVFIYKISHVCFEWRSPRLVIFIGWHLQKTGLNENQTYESLPKTRYIPLLNRVLSCRYNCTVHLNCPVIIIRILCNIFWHHVKMYHKFKLYTNFKSIEMFIIYEFKTLIHSMIFFIKLYIYFFL